MVYLLVLMRGVGTFKSKCISSKYSHETLKKCLEKVLGKKRIEDLNSIVVIPTVNLTSGEAVVIKTDHQPNLTRDGTHLLVEVALAPARYCVLSWAREN